MLLGAHVSISGGVFNAIARGKTIGCTAIQIFTKNQMQWKAKELTNNDIEKFKTELKKSTLTSVISHDSYLINLGSPNKDMLIKSRNAFGNEMQRTEVLGIPFLVFHPGAHLNFGEDYGLHKIAESLNMLLDQYKNYKLMPLLETTAGQGTNLGYRFEQLSEIIEMVEQKDRVGVCFDTAHVFAAGYDIRTRETYEKTFNEFDKIVGLEKLKAFHLNDSKKVLGSRVDRHENIGQGYIGLESFRILLNDPRFENVPKILETPGKEQDFKKNLDLLKSLTANRLFC